MTAIEETHSATHDVDKTPPPDGLAGGGDLPDFCPNCHATLTTGWGYTIGTSLIGCTACQKLYNRDELKQMMKEQRL